MVKMSLGHEPMKGFPPDNYRDNGRLFLYVHSRNDCLVESNAFVVCSFIPRLYDYHPEAIPAPYNHSNVDSDEVLYYVDGDLMSRNNIDKGYISLHPAGIPHGPHSGTYEASIGKLRTGELVGMTDTFKPLQLTQAALNIDDGEYYQSWL